MSKSTKKPPRSALVESILWHIKKGLIAATDDNSSAPDTLRELTQALQDILAGEDPDTALRIERSRGTPGDAALQASMAQLIYLLKSRGEKMEVIRIYVNEWRQHHGLDPLALSTIKNVDRTHSDDSIFAWLQLRDRLSGR